MQAGETGWVFPAEDRAALAATLRDALLAPAGEIARLRRNVLARSAGYTYRQAGAGLLAAIASLPPA